MLADLWERSFLLADRERSHEGKTKREVYKRMLYLSIYFIRSLFKDEPNM